MRLLYSELTADLWMKDSILANTQECLDLDQDSMLAKMRTSTSLTEFKMDSIQEFKMDSILDTLDHTRAVTDLMAEQMDSILDQTMVMMGSILATALDQRVTDLTVTLVTVDTILVLTMDSILARTMDSTQVDLELQDSELQSYLLRTRRWRMMMMMMMMMRLE